MLRNTNYILIMFLCCCWLYLLPFSSLEARAMPHPYNTSGSKLMTTVTQRPSAHLTLSSLPGESVCGFCSHTHMIHFNFLSEYNIQNCTLLSTKQISSNATFKWNTFRQVYLNVSLMLYMRSLIPTCNKSFFY